MTARCALHPLSTYLLVDVHPEPHATLRSLVSSGACDLTGTVVAAGDGYLVEGRAVPLRVAVGDVVLFDASSGTSVPGSAVPCRMLEESLIIAFVSALAPDHPRSLRPEGSDGTDGNADAAERPVVAR